LTELFENASLFCLRDWKEHKMENNQFPLVLYVYNGSPCLLEPFQQTSNHTVVIG
jgi:hypothetical protein